MKSIRGRIVLPSESISSAGHHKYVRSSIFTQNFCWALDGTSPMLKKSWSVANPLIRKTSNIGIYTWKLTSKVRMSGNRLATLRQKNLALGCLTRICISNDTQLRQPVSIPILTEDYSHGRFIIHAYIDVLHTAKKRHVCKRHSHEDESVGLVASLQVDGGFGVS